MMYKIISVSLIFIFFSFLFIQCEKQATVPTENPIRSFTELEKQVAASSDKFGLNIFRETNRTQADSNIFISPLSISMALGMTLNGANGTTYDAMKSTLEFDGLSGQEINETYQSLIKLLTQVDPKVVFQIANSIWYREGWTFEQEFIDTNKEYFSALVKGLDFNDPAAPSIINNWVNTNTNGKIEKIIESIDPTTVMFLINAIYFNGTWKYEFDKDETIDDSFYLPNGSSVPCKLMVQDNDFDYFENSDFQAVDLPYGNNAFSMTIILPHNNKNIDSLITQFNDVNWTNWIGSLTPQKGKLLLPKFKLEYKIKLNDILSTLGMGIAFSPGNADFSRMYTGPFDLFISKVDHKTFVDVNEEGTEAAAVTSVSIGYTSGGGSGFLMRVDHPFIFVIREKNSGTILFIGKIVEPTLN